MLAGVAVGACLAVPRAAIADVSVVLKDGRATVIAHDATPRQVLAEWARVGRTRIVNLEKVPGGPMTVELRDVPEARALQVLLQSVAGYIAAPRAADAPDTSHFDRILILPTSVAAAAPVAMRPAPYAIAQPQPPAVYEVPDPTALANDEPADTTGAATVPAFPANGVTPGVIPGNEASPQGPPVQPYDPPVVPAPAAAPQAPPLLPTPGQTTTPTPGVVPAPAPQQPQQPQR